MAWSVGFAQPTRYSGAKLCFANSLIRRRQTWVVPPCFAPIRRVVQSPFRPNQYFPDRPVRRRRIGCNFPMTRPNRQRWRRVALPWRGREASGGCRECCAKQGTTANTSCSHCRRHKFLYVTAPSENDVAVKNHVRVGLPFHRQMAVNHFVAKDAADIALHHAAKAVVTGADGHADVVDFVLE